MTEIALRDRGTGLHHRSSRGRSARTLLISATDFLDVVGFARVQCEDEPVGSAPRIIISANATGAYCVDSTVRSNAYSYRFGTVHGLAPVSNDVPQSADCADVPVPGEDCVSSREVRRTVATGRVDQ